MFTVLSFGKRIVRSGRAGQLVFVSVGGGSSHLLREVGSFQTAAIFNEGPFLSIKQVEIYSDRVLDRQARASLLE